MGRTLGIAIIAAALVAASFGEAAAQPGQTPPGYQPPPPPIQLTPHEYKLLQRGEYSGAEIAGSGLLTIFMGLGIGHAVQGRWHDKGWIFTVGEIVSVGVAIYGIIDCVEHDIDGTSSECNAGPIVVGMIAAGIFRIWELIDIFAHPLQHNREVRDLRYRLGWSAPRWSLYAAPPKGGGSGGVAGLTLRF